MCTKCKHQAAQCRVASCRGNLQRAVALNRSLNSICSTYFVQEVPFSLARRILSLKQVAFINNIVICRICLRFLLLNVVFLNRAHGRTIQSVSASGHRCYTRTAMQCNAESLAPNPTKVKINNFTTLSLTPTLTYNVN